MTEDQAKFTAQILESLDIHGWEPDQCRYDGEWRLANEDEVLTDPQDIAELIGEALYDTDIHQRHDRLLRALKSGDGYAREVALEIEGPEYLYGTKAHPLRHVPICPRAGLSRALALRLEMPVKFPDNIGGYYDRCAYDAETARLAIDECRWAGVGPYEYPHSYWLKELERAQNTGD